MGDFYKMMFLTIEAFAARIEESVEWVKARIKEGKIPFKRQEEADTGKSIILISSAIINRFKKEKQKEYKRKLDASCNLS